MSKTISILGCGWLGEPLAEYLLTQGHRVKGSTTTPGKLPRLAGKGIQPYLIDLGGTGRPAPSHDFFGCDVLFLNIPPGRRDPNVREHFLARIGVARDAAREAGTPAVILASSTSVYPDLNRIVFEDDDSGNPGSESGAALLEAEWMLRGGQCFATTILRFAGLYGYDRHPGQFMAGREDVPGGDAPVNLVHRDDCVRIVAEIIRGERYGAVFNVCSDLHPPRRIFYSWATGQLGLRPPTFLEGSGSFKIVSNTKVREALGYTFIHPDPMQPAP